jgi:hypothetical protein
MTDAAAAPAPTPAKPSVMDCAEIYYAPTGVFERRRQGKFGIPLLVYVIAMAIAFFATKDLMRPFFDMQAGRQMEQLQKQHPEMTQEQLERGRAMGAKFAGVGVIVGSALVPLVAGLLIWLVAKFAGAGLGLAQGMVVGVFMMFPAIIEYLINAIQMTFVDSSTLTSNYDISIGPSRFMHDASAVVRALVGHIDLFTIWMAFLIYLGVKVIGHTSKQTAATVAVIMWIIGVLPALLGAMKAG